MNNRKCNADFGDFVNDKEASSAASRTEDFFGGRNLKLDNTIEFITIASTGNATDFGDITSEVRSLGTGFQMDSTSYWRHLFLDMHHTVGKCY